MLVVFSDLPHQFSKNYNFFCPNLSIAFVNQLYFK